MKKPLEIFVLLYDNFSDFEIVQAMLVLHEHNLHYVGFSLDPVQSYSGFKVLPDLALDDIKSNDIDVFIIPGGEPKYLIQNPAWNLRITKFNQLLNQLLNERKIIAAICGGPVFLGNSGILSGKKFSASIKEDEMSYFNNATYQNADISYDGNVLTAQGQAFTEFALELGKLCGCITSSEDYHETLNWFRNKKE